MAYLTPDDVKEGVRGPASALNFTIKHWGQNKRLTEEQAREFFTDVDDVPYAENLCGLCTWYNDDCERDCEGICPVYEDGQYCPGGDSLYKETVRAWEAWKYDRGPFSAWTEAAGNMHEYLKSLNEKK